MTLFSMKFRTLFKCNFGFLLILLFSLSPMIVVAQSSKITWHTLKEAQQMASKTNKKILIFAEEEWNVYCKKMKNTVFANQAVIDSINNYFYPVKLDVTSKKPIKYNKQQTTPKKFARHYHIQAMPTTLFLDSNGNKLAVQPGYISAKEFSRLLGFIGSEAFHTMNFKTYLERYANQ